MTDLDRLDAAEAESRATLAEKRQALKEIETALTAKKELRKAAGEYRHTKPTIEAYKKLKGKKAESYRQANEADFIIHEAAGRKLKELLRGGKLPAVAKLNAEIESLISAKNAAYNEYRAAKAEHDTLFAAQQNAQKLYRSQSPTKQKKHEQER